MFFQLFLIAAGTLASEDLALAAAGVLVSQGKLAFIPATAAGAAGIFVGDMLLYLAGRASRRWPFAARLLRRWIPDQKMERGATWLNRNGLAIVLLSRFTPGLRLPTYFAAGVLPTRWTAFAAYFLIAALVWTPLLVGAAGLLHSAAGGVAAFAGVAGSLWVVGRGFAHRQRIIAFLRRYGQWEFWPAWAAYIPVVPYLLYLALRHRSLTIFTAANPAIPGGGLAGESKSAILGALARAGADIGVFTLIPAGLSAEGRCELACEVAARSCWPIVLKPDAGERGSGVAIVRSRPEVERYLAESHEDVIAQSYHHGLEFGVFYYRFPGEARGCVLSITEKRFPAVTGDGRRTFRELIQADRRASCIADAYLRASRRDPESVPLAGESCTLVEIGSHCRGAIFLDAREHRTAALEAEAGRISHAFPGFHFGRFDVRAESVEDLRAGRFRVIELNGVAAEAAHIYDPAVSIWSAYRSLFEQWRIAFAIGAANRARGVKPMKLAELVRLIRGRRHRA